MFEKKFCTSCHSIVRSRTRVQGSILVELFLWILFIIPGLIYSIARLWSIKKVCPECGADALIPLDTPRARALMAADQARIDAAKPQPARDINSLDDTVFSHIPKPEQHKDKRPTLRELAEANPGAWGKLTGLNDGKPDKQSKPRTQDNADSAPKPGQGQYFT